GTQHSFELRAANRERGCGIAAIGGGGLERIDAGDRIAVAQPGAGRLERRNTEGAGKRDGAGNGGAACGVPGNTGAHRGEPRRLWGIRGNSERAGKIAERPRARSYGSIGAAVGGARPLVAAGGRSVREPGAGPGFAAAVAARSGAVAGTHD